MASPRHHEKTASSTHHKDEMRRLEALDRYHISDETPDPLLDDLAELAAYICNTPMSALTLISRNHQWIKAQSGMDYGTTPRDHAFCDIAVTERLPIMIVEDALDDPRFRNKPAVTGEPHIRFYAGASLVTHDDEYIGALCVVDTTPRELDNQQIDALSVLARQAMALLELRQLSHELARSNESLTDKQQRIQQLNDTLTEWSLTDALTGVANRRAFDQRLHEECDRAERNNHDLALLMIDADAFKPFNDTYGHAAGDDALRTIADILERSARSYDCIARYGGEEFGMILPETDAAGAAIVAERIRCNIEAHEWPLRQCTVSIGVANRRNGETVEALLHNADSALYKAKRQGRNRVVLAD